MRRERPGNTLQTTALAHEAYLRLVDAKSVRWQNRAHFFAVAPKPMRRILVDLARARHNLKCGGGARQVSLDAVLLASPERGSDMRSDWRLAKGLGCTVS
ncbi:MAG: ECF-type sigma factor [Pyrinomonadaceae bacterium]